MYSLGLNIGHNATAALAKDGEILGCVSEERFTKIKNHWGIPKKAVFWLLKSNALTMQRIDKVVVNANTVNGHLHLKQALTEKVDPRHRLVNADNSWTRLKYGSKLIADSARVLSHFVHNMQKSSVVKNNIKKISRIFRVPAEKIFFLDHHTAHALTCSYNIPQNEKWLVFTLDGEGDDLCATVSIFKDGKLKRVAETPYYKSMGKFYENVTEFLGMKAFEHEYKVMGLAPYAKEKHADKAYQVMKNLIWLDRKNPLVFDSAFQTNLTNIFFEKKMRKFRFDNFAAGAQKLVEVLTAEWVKNGLKKYKIYNVALAGGVFMNVKANKCIMELPELKKFYVFPSCADESLAVSNAVYGYEVWCNENNKEFTPVPLKALYLGPGFSNEQVGKFLKKMRYDKKYKVEWVADINKRVGELLANDKIVARCSGRMEFGARALGNRSILTNPHNYDNVRVLNEMIKDRDFWMPFTPSILADRADDYFVNPKKINAPYMILTFDTKEKAKTEIIAAVHPYDFTARPQVVEKDWNPDYYAILKVFENKTGIGGVLNTSFNVHGLPIAMTPVDAMFVFENSSLPYLAMGNWLVSKK